MPYPLSIIPQGELDVVMTRAFDAPRNIVFDALTTHDLLRDWLGVRGGWTLPICSIDLAVGGAYRFVWRNADGTEMGVGGACREVLPPERIVWTEKFDEAWYPGEALVTHELAEEDGKTVLTATMHYESPEVRNAVLRSPMETSVAESYEKLDQLLAELISARAVTPTRTDDAVTAPKKSPAAPPPKRPGAPAPKRTKAPPPKRPVTLHLDEGTIDYFEELAAESDIPYETVMALYLRECAASRRRLTFR